MNDIEETAIEIEAIEAIAEIAKEARESAQMETEWDDLDKEKNEVIKDLEERLEREGEANIKLSKKVDNLIRDKRELSNIIAGHMDRTDDGELYIEAIWERLEKHQYKRILELLDIPLSEKEISYERH